MYTNYMPRHLGGLSHKMTTAEACILSSFVSVCCMGNFSLIFFVSKYQPTDSITFCNAL